MNTINQATNYIPTEDKYELIYTINSIIPDQSNNRLTLALFSHLHDGAGLHLPLRVRQPPHHLRHQAGGDLAHLQPRLPLLHHPLQRPASGRVISFQMIGVLVSKFSGSRYSREGEEGHSGQLEGVPF